MKGINYCIWMFLILILVLLIISIISNNYMTENMQFSNLHNITIKVRVNYEILSNVTIPRSIVPQWIESNKLYSTFNITAPLLKKRVTVLIIVSTAPRRYDRRLAIRRTWWADCKIKNKVKPECIFMTDYVKPLSPYYQQIQNENSKYGDLRFQHLDGGIQFGIRYLYQAIFAMKNYDFDYLLRMDDDYFFCMQNFLQEIPLPMIPNFHWGWVHRTINKIMRPEESMVLFSKDLIIRFLSQDPNTMMCHPWADQMIGEWTNTLNISRIFRHDYRLHHTPVVSESPIFRSTKNICNRFMGIHGCYPPDMQTFWKNKGPYIKTNRTLFNNSKLCTRRERYNWKVFNHEWNYEPKLCITNPTWKTSKQSITGGSYTGRQHG